MKKYKRVVYAIVLFFLLSIYTFFLGDTIRGEAFSSQIVHTEEKFVQNSEYVGYLTYGPYLSYNQGKYSLYIYGESDEKEYSVDIYSGKTGKEYYEGTFKFGKKISFELDQDIPDLEIRVFYPGTGMLGIEKVVVVREYNFGTYLAIVLLNVFVSIILCLNLKQNTKMQETIAFFVQLIKLWIISGILVTVVEYLRTERMIGILQLIDNTWRLMALNVTIVFVILTAIYLLTKRMGISVLVGGMLFYVLAIVDYNYYELRGECFKISELALMEEAGKVISGYSITVPHVIWIALILLLCIIIVVGFHAGEIKRDIRILGITACVVFFFSFYSNIESVILSTGYDSGVYVTKTFYDTYGYILGLVRTAPHELQKPQKYNPDYIKEVLGRDTDEKKGKNIAYPNIIYIQNETFYDLELVMDKNWSEDPLASFKELQKDYTSGILISPTTGGGTCNVEYEVLTAYPYSNTGGTPYVDSMEKEIDSVVSILNKQGYQTEAIHLNQGDFFNRKVAYSNLGFDKIMFSEDSAIREDDVLFNGWFGDRAVYKRLIEEFEARDKESPYFAHVVTTQNHASYVEAYDKYGISVEVDMDEESKRQLQTYLNQEKESVESLIELLQYFENVTEPTIIVFWGDHCPSFSLFGMSTEDEKDSSMGNYLRTHMTPLLIWNNYGLEAEELGTIAAYNISPYILNMIDIDTDAYMNYMYNNSVPDVLNEIEILSEDEYEMIGNWNSQQKQLWDNIWLLQYDRMFGRGYSQTG